MLLSLLKTFWQFFLGIPFWPIYEPHKKTSQFWSLSERMISSLIIPIHVCFQISLDHLINLFLCWSQSINSQYCGWISPCGSLYDYNMPFSNNHQETLKK